MSVVITRDDIIAYAEVDYIIHHMNEKYIDKLPESLLRFFGEIKDPEHEIHIDPYKPLQSQGLRKYTLEIVALLHLKYWCEDEERKKQLYDLMLRNQEKLEEQMREKFSIDNLFDNNSVKHVSDEADLEEEDFSKPRKVNRVVEENNEDKISETSKASEYDIQSSEENTLPQEISESKEVLNIFEKIKKTILSFFKFKTEK